MRTKRTIPEQLWNSTGCEADVTTPALILAAWRDLLRCSDAEINALAFWSQHRYKHYQIPKRSGGMRDIYHPTPALKVVQRWIVANVIASLPVHDAVYSYRQGISIRDHIKLHQSANFVLRLDFENFFPSITERQVVGFIGAAALANRIPLHPSAVSLIGRVVCRREKGTSNTALSIGAPSSPAISNAILYEFDCAAAELSTRLNCHYSRYADDLYFSTSQAGVLRTLEAEVEGLVGALLPNQALNRKKTAHLSRKSQIRVTGLVLTPQRKISVGRDIKRSIKTEIHLWSTQSLPFEKLPSLKGRLAYVQSVESDFIDRLKIKFGADLIERLMRP